VIPLYCAVSTEYKHSHFTDFDDCYIFNIMSVYVLQTYVSILQQQNFINVIWQILTEKMMKVCVFYAARETLLRVGKYIDT
jgi:hypothetical protein